MQLSREIPADHRGEESFSKHGYTKQEFDGEELVDVDEDEEEDYESEIDDSYDDDRRVERGKEYMAESTNTNETYQPMTFDAIKIGLASPEKIREWSRGEVTETGDHQLPYLETGERRTFL